MKKRSVFIFITVLAGAFLNPFGSHASSRVGNGEIASLDFLCDSKEEIYHWCEAFESAAWLQASDLQEGNNDYFSSHTDFYPRGSSGALRIYRRNDELSYAWVEGSGNRASLLQRLESEPLRALSDQTTYLEFLDLVPASEPVKSFPSRIVIRRIRGGGVIARLEVLLPGARDFTEQTYQSFRRSLGR